MNDKLLNWNTSLGYRKTRWGGTVGGLVDEKYIWYKGFPNGLIEESVLIIGERCYALSDTNCTAVALNLSSGKTLWTLPLEDNNYFLSSNAYVGNDDYLVMGSYVIDAQKGELIADLSKLTGDIVLDKGEPIELRDGKIFVQINGGTDPGKVLVYHPESRSHEIIDVGSVSLCMPNVDMVYGWKWIDDRYLLYSYDFITSETKSINPDIELGLLRDEGNHLLIMNESDVTMWLLPDASLLWSRPTDSLLPKLNPEMVYSFNVAMCEDTLGIYYSEHFVQLDRSTGETLWTHEFGDWHSVEACIVGDLIYGAYEVRSAEYAMFAMDRYTGEMLWSENSGMPLASCVAKGNKVLYTSRSDEILCFEWDESKPYHSPARPES